MAKIVIEICTDNAAFMDMNGEDLDWEYLGNLVQDVGTRITNCEIDFFIRDANGNTVGQCSGYDLPENEDSDEDD